MDYKQQLADSRWLKKESGTPFHLKEQILSFVQRKVKEVIETRKDILEAFETFKFWEELK